MPRKTCVSLWSILFLLNYLILAVSFGNIFDMVALATQCNFRLLLKDGDGKLRKLRKVKTNPIYFVDGFGTIGVSENGKATCPESLPVYDWAKKNHLLPKGYNIRDVEKNKSPRLNCNAVDPV